MASSTSSSSIDCTCSLTRDTTTASNNEAEPVVSVGSIRGNWKLTASVVSLRDIFNTIKDYAFNETVVNNYSDPIFIYLDIKTKYTGALDQTADLILQMFGDRILDKSYRYQRKNICETSVCDLMDKVVIMSNTGFQNTRLEEYVNISTSNGNLQRLEYSDIIIRKNFNVNAPDILYKSNKSELQKILNDENSDLEIKQMAETELIDLEKEYEINEKKLKLFLLPKDEADKKNAIIEIRAGTGGLEASLFAADLFKMYEKVSHKKKWSVELISISRSEAGGLKEVIASIKGNNIYSTLKYESGVHRVQRVPDTETQGRVHTSAATVAVLPEAEEVDLKINESDLRIDVFRAGGPGGQSVNTTDSAVRITHIPTGLSVSQQDEKSQHKNKAKGMKILRARLYELERSRIDQERSQDRKSKIGTGDRSERIRTYNFPQGRVTDHRINLTLHKLEEFLEGEAFDEMIESLTLQAQEESLGSLN